jgi:DNA-binding CsgD family transcriptional regulator
MTAVVVRSAGLGSVLEVLRDRTTRRAVIPFTAPRRPDEQGPLSLTKRECEVLLHVGAGETSSEICRQLGISRKTVENHKQRIFAKLDVQNQAHAIALAMRRGLIAHPSAGTPITG